MAVIEINDKKFDEIINENEKVLVDCFAEWCGPCKMLSPIIDEVSEEIGDVKFYKLNIEENEEISSKFSIMSIPTLLYFKNGKLVSTNIGFKSKEEIINIIK